MIFVTVGTQFPFDRLTGTVDAWAARTGRQDVFAQIGGNAQPPKAIEHEPFIDAARCHKFLEESELVIAHAGMGTVLTCLAHGTPVIVMARRAELGEHRNDHQVATVEWMRELSGVTVVDTPEQLTAALEAFETAERDGKAVSPSADPALLATVRGFVEAAPAGRRSLAAKALGAIYHPWNKAAKKAKKGGVNGQPVPAVPAHAPVLARTLGASADSTAEGGSDEDRTPQTTSPEPRGMVSAATL